ncbi:MAG: methyltransferase domain-containing protein [Nanoarchaeota archaeon]|nr:methyltransferase domain-containing protein [Nanoarchaeota archaeon]
MKVVLPEDLPNRLDGIELDMQDGFGAKQSIKRTIIKKNLKGKKILDIGCGEGEVSMGLGDITGVDVSEPRLKIARENGLKTVKADVCKIPLNEQFDAVIVADLIEHMQRPYDLLMEANRLLKPKGQIFLETPNALNFMRFLQLLFREKTREESPNHLFLFDRISLTEMLLRTDFVIDKIYYYGFTFPGWRFLTARLGKGKYSNKTKKYKVKTRNKNLDKLSLISKVGWVLGRLFKPFAYSLLIVAHKKGD